MIGQHDGGVQECQAGLLRLRLNEDNHGQEAAANHDKEESRQNPKSAACKKIEQMESFFLDVFDDLTDDQTTAYDKENIDTNIASGETGKIEMRADDRQNGNCT